MTSSNSNTVVLVVRLFSLQEWSEESRLFFNCFVLDTFFVVVSPILLIYSSKELRKTIVSQTKNMMTTNKIAYV